jgi:hypothetical protein
MCGREQLGDLVGRAEQTHDRLLLADADAHAGTGEGARHDAVGEEDVLHAVGLVTGAQPDEVALRFWDAQAAVEEAVADDIAASANVRPARVR